MKIFVNSRLIIEKPTGIQNYIINLYKELLKADTSNSYVFIQPKNKPQISNTAVIKTPRGVVWNILFDCFLVNRILKKEKKGDIIYHGTSFILPFFKFKNIKYVLTVHDLSFKLFRKNHSKIFNIYYDFILKRSLKYADKIIAVSKNTKNDIIKICNINPEKIYVTHESSDKYFDTTDTEIKRIHSEDYFLAIAGQPKRKNINSIINVLARSDSLRKYRLVIVGDISSRDKNKIINLAKDLNVYNNILFTGYVSKESLRSLYHYAKFFIYPTFYEGFGIPVLEAMMSKCPIVVSNTSCLPEIVPVDYQYLINPYSAEDIKQKMESIVSLSESERERLISENYGFSKKFSWEKCAKETLSIFKSLINK